MSPSTGLPDGARIAIHASGFHPFTNIQVEECAGTVATAPLDNTSCEGGTGDTTGYTNGSGLYVNDPAASNKSLGYKVMTLPRPNGVRSPVTCDATHACLLYIGEDQNDFTQPHTFADISFADAPVTAPTIPRPVVTVPAAPAAPTGAGTPSQSVAVSTASTGQGSPAASLQPTAVGGTLAATGLPSGGLVLLVGAIAIVAGSLVRRRALQVRA